MQMQQMQNQQMQNRMISRPAAPLPLRPKNVPYERMPPRVGDVPQTAENAVPAMQRYASPPSLRKGPLLMKGRVNTAGQQATGQGKVVSNVVDTAKLI
jgi:hypothetical protein